MAASASFFLLYLIHSFYYVNMVFCYCFPAKVLILIRRISYTMAGVFGQLIRPQKRLMKHSTIQMDPKALELETAKEILAEIFGVRIADVEEMIQNRFEADDMGSKENGLWPREFWLEG
jgi:hypothetical protein